MSAVESRAWRASLVGRAAAILTRPKGSWTAIAEEPAGLRGIFSGYVIPLAAIPPVCGVAGGLLFGSGIAGIEIRPTARGLLAGAGIDYLFTLAGVYLLSLIVAAVSPLFGGVGDRRQALKLAAHSGTAVWVCGVFALLPSVGFAVMILASLYSLFTLGEGLPVLMRTPESRALTCFALIVILALVLAIGLGSAAGALRSMIGGPLQVVAAG